MVVNDNPDGHGQFVTITSDGTTTRQARAGEINAEKRRYEKKFNVKLTLLSKSYSETHGFLLRSAFRYRIGRYIPETNTALNDLMEFEHVIHIHPDRTYTEPEMTHAPEIVITLNDDGQISDDAEQEMIRHAESQGWDLMTGYTGQYGYRGPIMHPSEYVGGGLADDILESPGMYVVVEVTGLPSHTDYVVSDSKDVQVGDQTPILGRFDTEDDAARFISTLPEHLTGRYNLDGPPEDTDPIGWVIARKLDE